MGCAGVCGVYTARDFVAAPRVSRDGRRVAWLAWDHPSMPWDSTELWVADLVGTGAGCRLEGAHRMAGRRGESLVQPAWAPDGSLYVVSDRSDWWNVYRVDAIDALSAVHGVDSEVGRPEWWFGQSRHAVADDGTVWLTVSDAAGAHLGGVEPGRRECSSHCCGRRAVVVVRGWRLAITGGGCRAVTR